eukprot:Colp12_sorted_trinity150504_noHs@31716
MIDLTTRTVLQTHPHNEYSVLRAEFLEADLDPGLRWRLPNGMFSVAKDTSQLVRVFMSEMSKLSSPAAQQEYLSIFNRQLQRRALALVQCVEAELAHEQPLSEPSIKRLRQDLGLTSDGDFKVILAQAELLRAGITTEVLGDPRSMEDKLQMMMEALAF